MHRAHLEKPWSTVFLLLLTSVPQAFPSKTLFFHGHCSILLPSDIECQLRQKESCSFLALQVIISAPGCEYILDLCSPHVFKSKSLSSPSLLFLSSYQLCKEIVIIPATDGRPQPHLHISLPFFPTHPFGGQDPGIQVLQCFLVPSLFHPTP